MQIIIKIYFTVILFFWVMIILINVLCRLPSFWKIKKYIFLNNYLNTLVLNKSIKAIVYIIVVLYLMIYRLININQYKNYSVDCYNIVKYYNLKDLVYGILIILVIILLFNLIFQKLDLFTSIVFLHCLLLPLSYYETLVLYILKIFIPEILKHIVKSTDKMIRKGKLTVKYHLEEILLHFFKYLIIYFIIVSISYDFYKYGFGVLGSFLYYLPFVLLINLIYRVISFYISLELKQTGWYFEYYKIVYQLKIVKKIEQRKKYVYIDFDL